ncbi:MAG: DUF4302 domain-containing protein [Prevotella sp.]
MSKIKFLVASLFVLPLLFSSCNDDFENKFDSSASERVDAYLQQVRTVLASATNGWVMDYYAGTNRAYGSYAFILKFDANEMKVTASCEKQQEESTSFYTLTSDAGPVLTFDTYNEVLHLMATPSSEAYQGKQGDFEFIIMSATPEKVILKGKRTGSLMQMVPLEGTPADYYAALEALKDKMIIGSAEGNLNDVAVSFTIDLDACTITSNQVHGAWTDNPAFSSTETVKTSFAYTPEGFRMYEDLVINGESFSTFTFDADSQNITAVGSNGNQLQMKCSKPANWSPFDSFEGTYELEYIIADQNDVETPRYVKNLTLVMDEDGEHYLLKGLNSHFDIVMGYSRSKGGLTIGKQDVGELSGYTIRLCLLDNKDSYLSWAEESGLVLCINPDNPNEYLFSSNGSEDFVSAGIILWLFKDGEAIRNTSTSSPINDFFSAHRDWLFTDVSDFSITNMQKLTRQ